MTDLAASGDRTTAGWEGLARGAWGEARALFESALELEETPEALEGLGMAAWWTDDAATTLDARERAFRLYRERDDPRGAARVAIALALDGVWLRGEEAVARGWQQRAARLLEGVETAPEHALFAIQEGEFALYLANDTVAARAAAARGAELGRELGLIDLEMLGLALEGYALVSEGRVDEGMKQLDEATAAAVGGEMRDLFAIGFACCFLMFACERVRDYDRAAQWCEHIKAFCARWGIAFLLSVCRTHYGSILMSRGDWAAAESELVPATEHLAATRPGIAADGLARLGELRRRQGRLDEAEALLAPVDFHPEAKLGLAALALNRGDAEGAAGWADRLLRQIPMENRAERVPGLEVLVRARSAAGDTDGARKGLRELRTTAVSIGTPLLLAAASAAEGILLAAGGDHAAARRRLEDAVDLFRQAGTPFEEAQARVELSRSLAALGHREEAQREAAAALEAFQALGATFEADRARSLEAELGAEGGPREIPFGLTPREVEVLRLVGKGMSNQEIARELVLSEHTVHRHVANILTKLGVSSRAAAAALAARHGIA